MAAHLDRLYPDRYGALVCSEVDRIGDTVDEVDGDRGRRMETEWPLGRRGSVLVVDDEEGVRESMRAILEQTCDILEAHTGAQAMEILQTHEVDLVMLDQRMP